MNHHQCIEKLENLSQQAYVYTFDKVMPRQDRLSLSPDTMYDVCLHVDIKVIQ